MEFTGYTPLMLAIAGGNKNLECVEILIHHGANINCRDKFGNNLFHIAALYNNNEIL